MLKAIVENEQGGFYSCIFDGTSVKVDYISRGLCKTTGCSREELTVFIESGGSALVHADDRDAVFRSFGDIMEKPCKRTIEYRILSRDGSAVWLSDSAASVFESDNKIHCYSIVTDINKLRLSRDDIVSVIESIPAAVVTYTYKNEVLHTDFFNSAICDLLRCSREEYLGLVSNDSLHFVVQEDRAIVRSLIEKLRVSDKNEIAEIRLNAPQGLVWLHIRAAVISRNGDEFSVCASMTDISSRKDAETHLHRQMYYQNIIDSSLSAGTIVSSTVFLSPPKYISTSLPLLFGVSAEEFSQMYLNSYKDIIYPDDYARISSLNEKYCEEKPENYETEFRAIKKDGTLIWISKRSTLINDADGEPAYVSVVFDITKHKQLEEQLRISSEETRIAMTYVGKMLCTYDVAQRTLTLPAQYAQLTMGDEVMRNIPESVFNAEFIDERSVPAYRDFFEAILQGKKSGSANLHFKWLDGTWHWEKAEFANITDSYGKPVKAIISIEDITDSYEKELAYQRYINSLESIPEAERFFIEFDLTTLTLVRADGQLIESFPDISKLDMNSIREMALNTYIYSEDRARLNGFLSQSRLINNYHAGKTHEEIDFRIKADGNKRWLRMTVELVEEPYMGHIMAFMLNRDIDSEKKSEIEILNRAQTDSLTGIYNRNASKELIAQLMTSEQGKPCALLIADIDDLKNINDSFGHEQGDRAILTVVEILKASFRTSDIISRYGGDEFVVYLPDMSSTDRLKEKLGDISRRLQTEVGQSDAEYSLSLSIGVALGIAGTDNYSSLLGKADKALYAMKRSGKNGFKIYSSNME